MSYENIAIYWLRLRLLNALLTIFSHLAILIELGVLILVGQDHQGPIGVASVNTVATYMWARTPQWLDQLLLDPNTSPIVKTKGIVYLLMGGCNAFFVGKTKRMLWQCIKAHVEDIGDGIPESPIARHFDNCYVCNLGFQAIDRIHPNPIGVILIMPFAPWITMDLNGFVSYASFLQTIPLCSLSFFPSILMSLFPS